MFHARYFEPAALLYRQAERGHLSRKCDECGTDQVCPEALPIDADYKECRFAGCQGGTLFDSGRILCGMCY